MVSADGQTNTDTEAQREKAALSHQALFLRVRIWLYLLILTQEARDGAECEGEERRGEGPFTAPEVVPKTLRKILSHFPAAGICSKKEWA